MEIGKRRERLLRISPHQERRPVHRRDSAGTVSQPQCPSALAGIFRHCQLRLDDSNREATRCEGVYGSNDDGGRRPVVSAGRPTRCGLRCFPTNTARATSGESLVVQPQREFQRRTATASATACERQQSCAGTVKSRAKPVKCYTSNNAECMPGLPRSNDGRNRPPV